MSTSELQLCDKLGVSGFLGTVICITIRAHVSVLFQINVIVDTWGVGGSFDLSRIRNTKAMQGT